MNYITTFITPAQSVAEILYISQNGNNQQKQESINYYKQNIKNFMILLIMENDFYNLLLKNGNYFDSLFLDEIFMLKLMKNIKIIDEIELNKKPVKDNYAFVFPNLFSLIKIKMEANLEVFNIVENVAQELSFFIFDIYTDKIINSVLSHEIYNLKFININLNYTSNIINYIYYHDETQIVNLILNINEEQQNKLIRLFLYKKNYFSHFLINNNGFFNLVINNATFLDVLFEDHFNIRFLIEAGDHPKIAYLLEKKLYLTKLNETLKSIVFNEDIKHNEQLETIAVIYESYKSVYGIIRQQFINEQAFVNILDSKLLKPIYIDNSKIYNELIDKCLQSYYLNESIILDTILQSNEDYLNEFINLVKNNSIHSKILSCYNTIFLIEENIDHPNIQYLFNQVEFIKIILKQTGLYANTFQFTILSKIKKDFEYSSLIRATILKDLKQENNKVMIKYCNDIYLTQLFENKPSILKNILLLGDKKQKHEIINFYNKIIKKSNKINLDQENEIKGNELLNSLNLATISDVSYFSSPIYKNIIQNCLTDLVNNNNNLLLEIMINSTAIKTKNIISILKTHIVFVEELIKDNREFVYFLKNNDKFNLLFTDQKILKAFLNTGEYYLDNTDFNFLVSNPKGYKIKKYKENIQIMKTKMRQEPKIHKAALKLIIERIKDVNTIDEQNYNTLYDGECFLAIDFMFSMWGF